MHIIIKNTEPPSLTLYRAIPNSIYDGPHFTAVKDDIRAQLLMEQGHICAYCNQRIKLENMKVEHWASQSNNSNLQLAYSNMLGCCKGGEGSPFKKQTCDTRKGNDKIKYSPANYSHHLKIKISYLADGTIQSSDTDFDSDINEKLNLNIEVMKSNRAAARITIQKLLNEKSGKRSKDSIRKLLGVVISKNEKNMCRPFYGIMESYLSTKL